jgi:hypothetical protein
MFTLPLQSPLSGKLFLALMDKSGDRLQGNRLSISKEGEIGITPLWCRFMKHFRSKITGKKIKKLSITSLLILVFIAFWCYKIQ